jgi:hypothetical protein
MVYSTQNYCVFGLFPSSGILRNRNTTFRKLDLFTSSGKDTYLVGPLERANLNHWTTPVRFTQLETRLIRLEITRKYTIKIVIKHSHVWNWDGRGGRNLCYKHNQQDKVHEHQCNRIPDDAKSPKTQ